MSQNPNNLQISKNYKSGEVKIKQCYEQVLEPQSSRVQDFQEQLNKSNYKAYMGQPRARNNSQQFKRINLESKIETSQISINAGACLLLGRSLCLDPTSFSSLLALPARLAQGSRLRQDLRTCFRDALFSTLLRARSFCCWNTAARTTPKKPIFIQARQPNIQQDNLDLMR